MKQGGARFVAKVELKQPIVDEIAQNIDGAQSVVLVDHRGLTVAEDTQLRKQLREAGVVYKVYKNTLMNFAFKGTDCEALVEDLKGPSAIAISKEDATAPARILVKFSQTAPKLELKAGIVEGTKYDADGLKAVADIPSREVLLSRLLGSMQSPIANLARVLDQIAEHGGAEGCGVAPKAEEEASAETTAEVPAEAEAPAEATAEAPVETAAGAPAEAAEEASAETTAEAPAAE